MTPDQVLEFLKDGAFMTVGPGRAQVAWGSPRRESRAPDGGAFFHPDFFFESSSPWFVYPHNEIVEVEELRRLLGPVASTQKLQWAWKEPDQGEFVAVFSAIQKQIQTGRLAKAVPVVTARADVQVGVMERAHLISTGLLHALEGSVTAYGMWSGGEGIVGVTPEVLCEVEAGRLKTMALAGTRRLDSADELLHDLKERSEHRFVVDGLVETLSALGEVKTEGPRVWRLPHIAHLRTEIHLVTERALDVGGMSMWLHPTPALGVYPRRVPWRMLKELPGQSHRGGFGAPFAYRKSDGSGKSVVAIRCLRWQEGEGVLLSSGCGIVSGSDLEREWQELRLKRETILKTFDLL